MLFKAILRPLSILLLVARAKKHNSLTDWGIVTAIETATVHSVHPWSVCLVLLFAFYLSGTKFTKYKHDIKKSLTVSSETGEGGEGPRNHVQVLANSLIASILIILHLLFERDYLFVGIVANYVAVCADTWSSELGILSKGQPILITTLRPCPKGTNGGVSPLGLGVAVAGGVYIGSIAVLFAPAFFSSWSIGAKFVFVLAAGFFGLLGSILDSLLGAVLQKSVVNKQGKIIETVNGGKLTNNNSGKTYSGNLDVLSNNQVNFAMAALTSLSAMFLYAKLFS
ncbi:hypothetical protein TRICI_004958 [Trichomonascus ciferrii]|uniref:Transmembrane protein 19 n=1 Tax=Trichomonascus ciferrii TaxID=44093 RepID=A0A642UZQ6_9ASCO|nr:hypothetical protein TRICI_004958 [Trichomonascus ciferrii]